jgi:hypothetical protein
MQRSRGLWTFRHRAAIEYPGGSACEQLIGKLPSDQFGIV